MTDDILREEQRLTLRRRNSAQKFKNKEGPMSKSRRIVMDESIPKKPRTSEDFYLFCKFILEYEKYDASHKEESLDPVIKKEDPGDSDEKLEQASRTPHLEEPQTSAVSSSDDDSYDLVTCFCGKPFAGRPMIECSKCLTWIHLRCAKVKKSEIPDIFICSHCKTTVDGS